MYLRRLRRYSPRFQHFILAALILLANLSLSAATFSDAGSDPPTPAKSEASVTAPVLPSNTTAGPPPVAKPPQEPKELIVLLAPGASAPTPAAFVDGVNQGRLPLKSLSPENPVQARFALPQRATGDALKELAANPDTPRARLERYVVLTYPPGTDLEKVKQALASDPAVLHVEENVKFLLSVSPSDPFFPLPPPPSRPQSYQWGSHVLNLEHAWDRVKGHAYIGITDTGLEVNHPDLRAFHVSGSTTVYDHGNFRRQLSYDFGYNDANVDENMVRLGITPTALGHGTHISGIVAATPNNGIGVAGACWNCSLMMAKVSILRQDGTNADIPLAALAAGTTWLVDHGAQVLNASLRAAGKGATCDSPTDQLGMYCTALAYADQRDVVMVAASGNAKTSLDFPASDPRVIAVGGIEANGTSWALWDEPQCLYFGDLCGSNYGANQALVAPAKQVLSTFYEGMTYIDDPDPSDPQMPSLCGNKTGYGLCTGTSMASPYVAGIAGLLRSANPLLTKDNIRSILTSHASNANSRNDQLGYGVPDADAAVAAAMGKVAGQILPNRLTPLFSLYSSIAQDYFYTTVPQMALAAHFDTEALYQSPPRNPPPVPGYNYPGIGGCPFPCSFYPSASVYIFTTDVPPYTGAPPLVALYRMSFKGTNPVTGNTHNRDTAYATTEQDLLTFKGLGYELDGIEGYIYQKCSPEPGCIPPGAVRLYRRFNSTRDDYAIFPESELAQMQGAGYTLHPLPDEWIGYVYPNVDSDGDGVIDGFEQLIGTDPHSPDSDCDGVSDGKELLTYGPTGYGDPNQGPCGKVIFADVPPDYWAKPSIEAFYAAKITNGCLSPPLSYCPDDPTNRTQIATLLLRSKLGGNYAPPAPNCNAPMFKDVPCSALQAAFIEEFARRGIITGCGDGTIYCPNDPITEAQLAVLLLRMTDGANFQPPPPSCRTPRFADVPCTVPQAAFIEELARRGLTSGCGGANYCPNALVTRAQVAVLLVKAFNIPPRAQTWAPLNHQPSFPAGTALLLTDGTVMVQQMAMADFPIGTGQWWRLTPDSTGNYQNGTWSQLATMPAGYAPLFYASAVLPDGRVVVVGGEYNSAEKAETPMGALYNPATNVWTSIAPPSGVTQIGDASSVVLANGTFLLGPCCSQATVFSDYLLNPSTLTWTATGTGKADSNHEEGWTLLPNGRVLTIDTHNGTNSEIYNPATGTWSSAGSTIVSLTALSPDIEIGPAVLRPDGTVFATGGTSNTAIYQTASGVWSIGPTFPSGLDVADGPAALLPNGNVLVDASPGFGLPGAQFFELNGAGLVAVPAPPRAPLESSYEGRMLVLPTGQILFTDGSKDVEIYTPSGTFQDAWRPTITSFPASVTPGTASYSLSGTQLNGLSQGAMYGDDAQSATNYPLVRITNNATNHVFYAKTHNHSTMAVATGSAIVSTQFDVPAGIETGPSRLEVVANGIPSHAVAVTCAPPTTLSSISISPASVTVGSSLTGTVTMSSAVSTSTSVTISSNNLSAVVPSSVTVPAGSSTANFSISTNTTNCAPLTATINATYNGTSKQANLAVNPATASFAGYHDSVDTNTIVSGWAWDANNPACRTQVDLYLDGTTFLTTLTANGFRQDLLNGRIGDGFHGWGYVLPSPLQDGLAHNVTAKYHATGVVEPSSPRGFAYNVPIFPTQIPNAVHCCATTEVGTWFHSSASGVIKALRFYQSANETGGTANNHTIRLWSSSGALLASVVVPFTAGAGWREGTLAAPYPIVANTDYVVSYGINHELAQYNCMPAFPFSNTVTKGNYTLTLTATQTKYNLTQGQFPNTAACSNPFIDIKLYAGTQTGSASRAPVTLSNSGLER